MGSSRMLLADCACGVFPAALPEAESRRDWCCACVPYYECDGSGHACEMWRQRQAVLLIAHCDATCSRLGCCGLSSNRSGGRCSHSQPLLPHQLPLCFCWLAFAVAWPVTPCCAAAPALGAQTGLPACRPVGMPCWHAHGLGRELGCWIAIGFTGTTRIRCILHKLHV